MDSGGARHHERLAKSHDIRSPSTTGRGQRCRGRRTPTRRSSRDKRPASASMSGTPRTDRCVQACRERRDRLYDMHVKDLASKTEKESQAEVGRGVIDFPSPLQNADRDRLPGPGRSRYEINAKNPLPGMIESEALHARRFCRCDHDVRCHEGSRRPQRHADDDAREGDPPEHAGTREQRDRTKDDADLEEDLGGVEPVARRAAVLLAVQFLGVGRMASACRPS